MSRIPSEFTAGDTIVWFDSAVPEAATAATAYLRGNVAGGATLSGTSTADGWRFTLDGAVSGQLTPGEWVSQIVAVVGGATQTVCTLPFRILQSLAYSGSPEPIDLRSQARKDLDSVEAAIRALTTGAQEYRIGFGNQGRTVRRADLSELISWRDRLAARVAAEDRKATGKADRAILVQFTPWA